MNWNATFRRDLQQQTDARVDRLLKWDAKHRRHFLRGAGGAMLALPFLPSLVSSKAEAQVAGSPRQKSFIGIGMYNHIANQHNANEAEAKVTPSVYLPSFLNMTPTAIAGKHTIYSKSLTAAKNDNQQGRISEIIDAAFNPFLDRMTILNGLDYLNVWGHHAGTFGNYHATTDTFGRDNNPENVNLDQAMAHSAAFYKNSNRVGQYVHWTGSSGDIATGPYEFTTTLANPALKGASPIVQTAPIYQPSVLWDKFFAQFTPPPPGAIPPDRRKTLVDSVIGDYRGLLSNRRLGGEDRQRLGRHVELLQTTQKTVMAVAPMCSKPARPSSSGVPAVLQAHNDVIVALIACGLCHSFLGKIFELGGQLSQNDNDWHAWSHDAASIGKVKAQMNGQLGLALDLAKKLDAQGLLDDTVIALPSEHGRKGHISVGANAVLIGSAGGAIKTGQFIDYRDQVKGVNGSGADAAWSGYPMNQFWANLLLAVDVPAAEFEAFNKTGNSMFGKTGFGANVFQISPPYGYSPKFNGHNMSTWLPLLKA